MTDHPTLRTATAADAPVIASLARQTFADTFGHLYSPENLASFLAIHTPENWAAEIADPRYAVRLAEANGQPVAYMKLGPPSLPFTPAAGAIELRQIYVLPTHHGGGLANAMMDHAITEARARGATALYLSVFTDNPRARRFYTRHGFVEVGPYAFMVGDQADEDIVMRLDL
ncbi:GNAT family N-acetyltransferase [Sphingomonas adhaesiva]|uniref:GNAT family N-acetyltransferase n=1 Tax=Sphingomonas adhaesiva TaxID=28212 RepID=UPI002FF5827E